MRKYELSISADYVPGWGIVEAAREFFQNSIDEQTRDSSNKMVFSYNGEEEKLTVGNKHSELDIKTLLFGTSSKADDSKMIGSHGEGYKIATVVFLRNGKKVVFKNYCRREVWTPRLVKSKKYDGALVPTFFVDNAAIWEKVPEHSLMIEISGITPEEYEKIKESNLHLQEYEKIETKYGEILEDEKYKGKVFVGGLFICKVEGLDMGLNFHPDVVRIERDRSMVESFDVQWYAGKMVAQTEDSEIIKKSLDGFSGRFIKSYEIPLKLRNEIAEDFINLHGARAVPVSTQEDINKMKKRGYKPVIVSESKKEIIMESEYYEEVRDEEERIRERERPITDRFCEFVERIEEKLTEEEVLELYGFLDEIETIMEGENE